MGTHTDMKLHAPVRITDFLSVIPRYHSDERSNWWIEPLPNRGLSRHHALQARYIDRTRQSYIMEDGNADCWIVGRHSSISNCPSQETTATEKAKEPSSLDE